MKRTSSDTLIIVLLGIAHGTSHFFHLVIPPLYPWLMPAFELNFAQAGLIMSSFYVVSTVGQATSGFLVDRFGARRCLNVGIFCLALGSLILALAQNYAMLVASGLLFGLGNCVFHPADYSIINRGISETNLAYAFSMHSIVGNIGWAIAPATMVFFASAFSWRTSAMIACAMGLAVLALMLVNKKAFLASDITPASKKAPGESAAAQSPFAFLGHPVIWLAFAFFFFTSGATGILQNFAPSVFGFVYGMTLEVAALSLTVYLVGSCTGVIAGGVFAKRASSTTFVVVASLGAAAVAALVLTSSVLGAWAVMPLMFAIGFGVGAAGPSRDMLVRGAAMMRFGAGAFGRIYGFVYCGMDVGGMLAPVIGGFLLDAGNYFLPLAFVALFQGVAILTVLSFGRVRSR